MRFIVAGLLTSLLIAPVCYAQNRAAMGTNLADDSDMYQRFVYDDAQTVGRKVALSLPVMPDAEIQDWLTDRIAQIMSVTPTLYPMHKNKVSGFFTPDGWGQLTAQWNQAQIPQLVGEQEYVMNAVVINTPQIIAKGRQGTDANATYRWIADMPVLLTYTNKANEVQSYNMSLRIGITRIPMRDDNQLIAIDQWGITPPKPAPEPVATP